MKLTVCTFCSGDIRPTSHLIAAFAHDRIDLDLNTLRIEPELKEVPRAAAERERRSIANRVEVLNGAHCERNIVPMEEPTAGTQPRGAPDAIE